ncbi:MAG: UDP-N-acetylglucosamine 2-epimerase (non-hydrolyzing) [Anaerolineae bacterium]|nr:UDP-N-acetylglucosamine 2-epimerase (non-hydrolyzing) [Anaerolineae bacterium]
MRIFTVVGARPQFIKAAPLSAALREQHSEFLVHTGQHYDDAMSDIFFRQLGIPQPDANLGIGGGSHAEQTGGMLIGLERLMQEQRPDWVLVYGDTNSTLAAALAAAKLHIPVAHIESGLRSYNRAMPEEINRVLTDHVSALLFCPTATAVENLAREGITQGVLLTGDIMVDGVLRHAEAARQQSRIHAQLGLSAGVPYAAATIHRPANTDLPAALAEIIAGLGALGMPVIFPAHPRTHKALETNGIALPANLRLIEPLGYLDMLALVGRAAVLLTDSGGLQKEAYVLRVPCVTVRSETEWVETVTSGWNRLCEPERGAIQAAVSAAMGTRPTEHPDFYGDGAAATRIVAALSEAHP